MSTDMVGQLWVELQQQVEQQLQLHQQQLREELQNLWGLIQSQQSEILSLRSSLIEAQSRSNQNHPHRPKPSLPDPDRFNGQTHKFDTWLPSIKAKLRIDASAIGGDIDQFYYVYLNLESSVQSMVLPQLDAAEERQVWDYQTILGQLSRIYDNPNKLQEAEDRLHHLKQGNESISAYIAKFERLLYAARGQDWPDTIKITTFRNGLGAMARQRLNLQLNLPRDYPGFIRTVQRLSGNNSVPANTYGTDQMDTSVGNINTINPILASLEQPRSPHQQSSPRAQSISPNQHQHYQNNGQCVRCGSHDHWVAACEFQPSIPPQRRQMAKRIPASNQGDTDDDGVKLDLDSDGWQSDYEAMMQASGDWGQMNVFVFIVFFLFFYLFFSTLRAMLV